MLVSVVEKNGEYERYRVVRKLNHETVERAMEQFEDYHDKEILLNTDFSDEKWILFNQLSKTTLDFTLDETAFSRYSQDWIGCNGSCFKECLKAYCLFAMGEFGTETIREIVLCIKQIAGMKLEEISDYRMKGSSYHLLEFLRIIPGESIERDAAMEELEEKMILQKGKARGRKQVRILQGFETYLRFDEILQEFWQRADDGEKLFYFPLYLWWKLTAVLPLRPTEFLLLPRDGLLWEGERYFLTIRRTRLKGGLNKVSYRVDGDYEKKCYAISEILGREMDWYMDRTKDMEVSELGTFFVMQGHYRYLGRKPCEDNRYYSYGNLSTCLNTFYREVVDDTDLEKIHLGDTRHLAMINLMISGGSPVICRELAGHSDINISAHYYANISSLVECATYERFRRNKVNGRKPEFVGMTMKRSIEERPLTRIGKGFCTSKNYADGRITDCIRSMGLEGAIGRCSDCVNYRDNHGGIRLEISGWMKEKKQVDADASYLLLMIEQVRKGLGHQEDVGSALLRLQQTSMQYAGCLYERYTVEDK